MGLASLFFGSVLVAAPIDPATASGANNATPWEDPNGALGLLSAGQMVLVLISAQPLCCCSARYSPRKSTHVAYAMRAHTRDILLAPLDHGAEQGLPYRTLSTWDGALRKGALA